MVTCVGSLSKAKIRLANATATNKNEVAEFNERFEILSLVGTVTQGGESGHLHVSLGDKGGKVVGGHLMDGCTIFTTAEIVMGVSNTLVFNRTFDKATGFDELEPSVGQNPPLATENLLENTDGVL